MLRTGWTSWTWLTWAIGPMASPAGPFLRLNYSGPNPAAFREAARILGQALARNRH